MRRFIASLYAFITIASPWAVAVRAGPWKQERSMSFLGITNKKNLPIFEKSGVTNGHVSVSMLVQL